MLLRPPGSSYILPVSRRASPIPGYCASVPPKHLTPVWQLDGSRGFHALARSHRYAVVGAIAVALLVSAQRLLFIVSGVAVWRALQRDVGPGDRRTLKTFVVLIVVLSLLARGVG